MRLNQECFVDILIWLEQFQDVDQKISITKLKNELNNSYSKEEVLYTAIKLKEISFIDAEVFYADNQIYDFTIYDITIYGHYFLHDLHTHICESKQSISINKATAFISKWLYDFSINVSSNIMAQYF